MVYLELSDDFVFSDRISDLSKSERDTLVNIGEHIYFNGKDLFNAAENEKGLYAFDKRVEEIRISSDKQIQSHAETVSNQYNLLLEGRESLLQSKQNEIDDLKARISKLEDENCQALSLSSKLDSLMGKGNTVDNAMKGDFGESIVANQIQHWYQTSEIEDKSAETAKGDLLWKLNSGEFRALVEVKNVQMVRPIEIQKFERDMVINTKDNSCNCGLFVSLKTETIPNKGKFKFEFINDCPVIYVSNILEDLNTLRFALDSLISFQMKLKQYKASEESDDETNIEDIIVEFVQKQYNKIEQLNTGIVQMRTSVETLTNCINTQENNVKEMLKSISTLRTENDLFKQIEQDYKVNSKEELKESILRDMRAFQDENGRLPLMSELTHKYKQSFFREELAYKKLKSQV